jgi:hypothetical protein
MMTAFFVLLADAGVREVGDNGGGARFVTRAKNARSACRRGQGRVLRKPIPRLGVVATIRVKGGRGGRRGIEVVVVMLFVGGGKGKGEMVGCL